MGVAEVGEPIGVGALCSAWYVTVSRQSAMLHRPHTDHFSRSFEGSGLHAQKVTITVHGSRLKVWGSLLHRLRSGGVSKRVKRRAKESESEAKEGFCCREPAVFHPGSREVNRNRLFVSPLTRLEATATESALSCAHTLSAIQGSRLSISAIAVDIYKHSRRWGPTRPHRS